MARTLFGVLPDGTAVEAFTVANGRVHATVVSYGATLTSLRAPDRGGNVDDVVLGFDRLDDYFTKSRYFGATVGRYANRIARGRFIVDGGTIQLTTNDGANHLHGGIRGFDQKVWKATSGGDGSRLTLSCTSRDGEEGYPGEVHAAVSYTLTPQDELVLDYSATTDKPTPINLTNHSYFNLAGRGRGDILQHQLTLHAGHYTPADAALIPTGEIAAVAGTPFDFRTPMAIGARIDADDEQIRRGAGYDHNFIINEWTGGEMRAAAHVADPVSGRTLDVITTEPGIQFYAGNHLDLSRNGFGPRTAFCLETQHFPDSPNHPNFPSTILRPGETYRSITVYRFAVDAARAR